MRLVLLGLASLVLSLAFAPGRSANAAVDLTGSWTLDLAGDLPIVGHFEQTCRGDITQTGENIAGSFDCDIATGDFTGTIDLHPVGADIDASLTITPQGFPEFTAEATGTVSPGGNSFSGTWHSDTYDTDGTFDGAREVLQYTKGDLNCDTNIDALDPLALFADAAGLAPPQQPDCPALDADVASVFGDIDCDESVLTADGIQLLRYLAGLTGDLRQGCRAIGETFTVPRLT